MKPLFIPLKTEFFEAFKSGAKRIECRLYGPSSMMRIGKPFKMFGYIWRVLSYHETNPYDNRDRAPYIHAVCLRPHNCKGSVSYYLINFSAIGEI